MDFIFPFILLIIVVFLILFFKKISFPLRIKICSGALIFITFLSKFLKYGFILFIPCEATFPVNLSEPPTNLKVNMSEPIFPTPSLGLVFNKFSVSFISALIFSGRFLIFFGFLVRSNKPNGIFLELSTVCETNLLENNNGLIKIF